MKKVNKYTGYMTTVKKWNLEYSSCGEVFKIGTVTCNKFDLLKLLKSEYAFYRKEKDGVYIKFEEVPYSPKPLTSMFLEKAKYEALVNLQKEYKKLYTSYSHLSFYKSHEEILRHFSMEGLKCSEYEYAFKQYKLHEFAVGMWNDMENEFYMTADICWNTIWKYQDALQQFDRMGYLLVGTPEKLSDWSVKIKENYHREWTVELLKLIKDFNLDNQPEDYVNSFMNDFKSVHDRSSFCSALYKWTELIRWAPEKLALLDGTYVQPISVHYEDDYNPDVDSDAILD